MFKDKCVIVTGGAGALGRAVVQHFQSSGAAVAVIDYSDDLMNEAFPDQASRPFCVAADLTDRESSRAAVVTIAEKLGTVDILANIAGGFMMGEAVHETSDKTWDFLFDLNTRSIVNMSAAVVPLMLANGGGKIVNVAARAATAGMANMGAYIASKSAVMRLTESMALELREQAINVNCIMPGTVDTPRNRIDMPDADHATWVPTTDLANVVGFLSSDASRAVHGAAIPVDGLS